MKKGFINIAIPIIVSGILFLASAIYSWHEVSVLEKENKNAQQIAQQTAQLGATVYTTQLTDTINTFRNQVNSSTANLNTELTSVSTTIHAYGNIVSQNVPLAANQGGTSTTTSPSANQFLSANGAIPTWKTLSSSTGITLIHTATTTIIGTAGFDNTANINFTGNNTHIGTETFNATTTLSSSTILSGNISITGNAVFSGSVSGLYFDQLISASTTVVDDTNNDATTTLLSVPISANILVGNNVVETSVFLSKVQQNAGGDKTVFEASYGGTVFASSTIAAGTAFLGVGKITVTIQSTGVNTQQGNIFMDTFAQGGSTATSTGSLTQSKWYSFGNSSVSATSSKNLILTVKHSSAGANIGITMNQYIVKKIINQ